MQVLRMYPYEGLYYSPPDHIRLHRIYPSFSCLAMVSEPGGNWRNLAIPFILYN